MAGESKYQFDPHQPLKPDLPDHGVYLNWPPAPEDWVHPEDLELARRLIPSRRVFRRVDWDGEYYTLQYGAKRLRVRPALWTQVENIDLVVGQKVELLARRGKNDPGIFRISDINYVPETGEVVYFLQRGGMRLGRPLHRKDLRPIHIQHKLRSNYYQVEPPRLDPSAKTEFLDVGDLE